MAIGVTAKLTAREGHSEQFETLFKELQDEVNAQEPGCLFYALHKSRSNPLEYIVLEQYENQEAAEAHQQTEYYRRIGAQLSEHVAGAPVVELFDSV